jgi:DNA ligase-1
VQQVSGASDEDVHQIYLARGDLGEMAERLLTSIPEHTLSPAEVQKTFADLVKISGAANKLPVLLDLFRSLDPGEAKYVIKIITGDLRIGLKENTVEEGVSKAFERPVDAVRRWETLERRPY